MKRIKDKGGLTIVQEPAECMIDTMPVAAMKTTQIDYVLTVPQIIDFLLQLDKVHK
jgi:two-component system chemotaxis response regulator CheB